MLDLHDQWLTEMYDTHSHNENRHFRNYDIYHGFQKLRWDLKRMEFHWRIGSLLARKINKFIGERNKISCFRFPIFQILMKHEERD